MIYKAASLIRCINCNSPECQYSNYFNRQTTTGKLTINPAINGIYTNTKFTHPKKKEKAKANHLSHCNQTQTHQRKFKKARIPIINQNESGSSSRHQEDQQQNWMKQNHCHDHDDDHSSRRHHRKCHHNRSRMRSRMEGRGKNSSKDREQNDPVAAKGGSTRDPTTGGC